jgi:hypothetical protein
MTEIHPVAIVLRPAANRRTHCWESIGEKCRNGFSPKSRRAAVSYVRRAAASYVRSATLSRSMVI